MKSRAIVRLVICSILALLLVTVLVCGLVFGFDSIKINLPFISSYSFSAYDVSSYNVGNGTAAAAGIKNINIDWVSGDVNIIAYDGGEVKVEESMADGTAISADNMKMRWAVDGETLRVVFCKPRIIINSFRRAHKTLNVYLPTSLIAELNDVDVDLVSADLNASGITCDKISTDSVSGKVRISDCATHEISADGVSGSYHFSGSAAYVDVISVSGEIELALTNNANEIELETTSGDMILALAADASFTADYDSVSGDFSCELPIAMKNGDYICGGGDTEISIATVSGDIAIIELK